MTCPNSALRIFRSGPVASTPINAYLLPGTGHAATGNHRRALEPTDGRSVLMHVNETLAVLN